MVSAELIDEVIYVSLKNEFISKELIEKIVMHAINNSDEVTKNLFSELTFKEDDWDFACATANQSNGQINIKYEDIIEFYSKYNDTSFLEINLLIMSIILHEVAHLKEKVKRIINNYESQILKYGGSNYVGSIYFYRALNKTGNIAFSDRYCERKFKLFYEQNHGIIPSERIADISSYSCILESLKSYPNFINKYFNEYKSIKYLYFKVLKTGYRRLGNGRYSIPIVDYFSALGRLRDLTKIGFDLENKKFPKEVKSFDLETKMMYGLPITTKDMIELNKKKIRARR